MESVLTLRQFLVMSHHSLDPTLVIEQVKEANEENTLDIRGMSEGGDFDPEAILIVNEKVFLNWIDSFNGCLDKKF